MSKSAVDVNPPLFLSFFFFYFFKEEEVPDCTWKINWPLLSIERPRY